MCLARLAGIQSLPFASRAERGVNSDKGYITNHAK